MCCWCRVRQTMTFPLYRILMIVPGSKVGQGIDFLLEQRNRRMKSDVIRNGIPTSDQWETASASMQSLDKIIDSVEERLNLHISSGQHKLDHSLEKKAARNLFRSNGLLDLSKETVITLLPNLHYDTNPFNSILRCQLLAETNRKIIYEGTIKTGQATVSSYISLFKSDNEEELVNSWGITKLRSATRAMTNLLQKDLSKEIHLELKSSDKNNLRQIYWRVYSLAEHEDDEA